MWVMIEKDYKQRVVARSMCFSMEHTVSEYREYYKFFNTSSCITLFFRGELGRLD